MNPEIPSNHLPLQEKQASNRMYAHPPNVILKVPPSLPVSRIDGINVYDITKFTSKFRGRMLTYSTHGLYIYPAKFIPQIPQFCIREYSEPDDIILDPMCGSGTTLLEAQLAHRNALGIDINPLARLISRVKTTPLNLKQLSTVTQSIAHFFKNTAKEQSKTPKFPNLNYWFSPTVLQDLSKLQQFIFAVDDPAVKDFFLLVLASIIREVSLADNHQLHPAKTKFSHQNKANRVVSTFQTFQKSLQARLQIISLYSELDFSEISIQLIGDSATRINTPTAIDLAITSPPYVNAIDYVRIHKLEAFWTGLLDSTEIPTLHQDFIGTENVYKEYYYNLPEFPINELNQIIADIASFDRKKAGIVALYFSRMFKNLREVYAHLRPGGHYCVVIGGNYVRNIRIPTPPLLIRYAESEIGYENVKNYSYTVINKRLKIPRARHGGNIKKEWIIVLQKN